jgi:hypothetical protein
MTTIKAVPFYLNSPTMPPFILSESDVERAKNWCQARNIPMFYCDDENNIGTLMLPIDCYVSIPAMLFANITNEDLLKIQFDYNDYGE